MFAKPYVLLSFLVVLSSCSSDIEESYIQLLENRIEELSASHDQNQLADFDEFAVKTKVKDYFAFTCNVSLKGSDIDVFRNAKDSWLVAISLSSSEYDEFGFPIVKKLTFEVKEEKGFLVPKLELTDSLCE